MTQSAISPSLLVLISLFLSIDLHTTNGHISGSPAAVARQPDQYALLVTQGHLEVLRSFSEDLPGEQRELLAASAYFRALFGVSVRWNMENRWPKPSSATREDVRKIQELVKIDRTRLRWNEKAGKVELVGTTWSPRSNVDWPTAHRLGVSFWTRQLEEIVQFTQDAEDRLGFSNASKVLTALTTIPVAWEGNYFGLMPTPETVVNVEQLRRWFKQNCPRLYWDEASGELRLGDAKASGSDHLCTDE